MADETWTESEDATLMSLKAGGETWANINKALSKTSKSGTQKRYKELKALEEANKTGAATETEAQPAEKPASPAVMPEAMPTPIQLPELLSKILSPKVPTPRNSPKVPTPKLPTPAIPKIPTPQLTSAARNSPRPASGPGPSPLNKVTTVGFPNITPNPATTQQLALRSPFPGVEVSLAPPGGFGTPTAHHNEPNPGFNPNHSQSPPNNSSHPNHHQGFHPGLHPDYNGVPPFPNAFQQGYSPIVNMDTPGGPVAGYYAPSGFFVRTAGGYEPPPSYFAPAPRQRISYTIHDDDDEDRADRIIEQYHPSNLRARVERGNVVMSTKEMRLLRSLDSKRRVDRWVDLQRDFERGTGRMIDQDVLRRKLAESEEKDI